MTLTRGLLFLLPALALLTTGCGESRQPVYPVAGKVSYQGLPPVGAQVVLHRQGGSPAGAPPLVASGVVKDDGTFQIGSYDANDGAPPGEYVATIAWHRLITDAGGSGRGPNVLPPQYSDPLNSPIKVSVKDGPIQLNPIELR
jgi:hypothetical protein